MALCVQSVMDFVVEVKDKPVEVDGLWPVPPRSCGKGALANFRTGDRVRAYCGSKMCPRPECQELFWLSKTDSLRLALQYLHRPPIRRGRFVTLTFAHDRPPEWYWASWKVPWNRFKQQVNYHHGSFDYALVVEKHPRNPYPHLHIIWDIWLAKREISSRWQEVDGGKVTWVEKVDDASISEYLSKDGKGLACYFGKDAMIGAYMKSRKKTVTFSGKVSKFIAEEKRRNRSEDWVYVPDWYEETKKGLDEKRTMVYSDIASVYMVTLKPTTIEEPYHG